jgi:putative colanic acid biosynthesis UDP-glucose lipid carrier transferase
MSLVGPRPHPLELNEEYKEQIDMYMQRHRVMPGITGLAQINGCRGEFINLGSAEKRIAYDLHYINNWSIWLDLKVLILTVVKGFFSKQAY